MLITAYCATGQSLAYRADYNFFFDNLENSGSYQSTRTLLAVSLAPEIGVAWDDRHSLMVGASMLQELGDSTFLTKANYIAYYKYSGDNFSLITGAFPRRYSIASYPNSFFCEASNFYNPTLGGVMMQYDNGHNGYVELYADWYGADQGLRIDEFMVVGSTEYGFFDKAFLVGGNMLLNHFKNEYYLEDSYLLERFLYNIYIGTDLSSKISALDEARISVGLLGSRENKRVLDTESQWQGYGGGSVDLALRYRGIGLKNSLYFGDGQMPYYSQYGGDKFYFGSPFYQSDLYNRTDIYYMWQRRFVALKANFIFNATDEGVGTQQMLTLNVNISQMLKGGKPLDYNSYKNYPW